MKTTKIKVNTNVFRGNVSDLKEGDRIYAKDRFWLVGRLMKGFDESTIRVTVTPETDMYELKNGEYTTLTFGKDVVL